VSVPRTELERRMRAFTETCRREGLKVTHQRREVFRELAGSEAHPDAETVFRQVRRRVPSISRDTVYRTLSGLADRGLLRRAESAGGPARYDANTRPHHHFVCTACGAIRDFESPALDRLRIPQSVKAFGRVDAAQVHVRGVCSSCMRRKDPGRRPPRPS